MSDIQRALACVRERIAEAALRAGRDPAGVTLIAVSKTFPVEAVMEAIAAGQLDFGENRVEEALPKIAAISRIQNAESRMQRAEAGSEDTQYALRNTQHAIQNPKSKIQNPKSKVHSPTSTGT